MADQSFAVESSFTIANDAVTPWVQNLAAMLAALDGKIAITKAGLSSLGQAYKGGGTAAMNTQTAALQKLGAQAQQATAQVAALSAAMSGASSTGAPQMTAALSNVGNSLRQTHASAGPARQAIVLLHEAISDRFNRIPGSLIVLAEYFPAIGIGAMAAVGGVTALGITVYELAKHAIEAHNALLAAEGAAAQLGQIHVAGPGAAPGRNAEREFAQGIDQLADKWGMSAKEAANWSQAVRSSMKVSTEEGVQDVLRLSAAMAQNANQWEKLPDFGADLAKKTQSFSGLTQLSDEWKLGMESIISENEKAGGSIDQTWATVEKALDARLKEMAQKTQDFHEAWSWKNLFAGFGEGDLGAAGLPTPATDKLAANFKAPSPAKYVAPPPIAAGQADPYVTLKQQLAEANTEIAKFRNDSSKTAAETAALISGAWSKIKLPEGVAHGSEEAQRVLNEQRASSNGAAEAQAAQNRKQIEAKYAAVQASGSLSPAGMAAAEAQKARELAAVDGQTADQRIENAQNLKTAQAAAGAAATSQQLRDLQTVVDKTREGSAARVAAEQRVYDFASSHYAKGSPQVDEATRGLETAQREQQEKQARAVDIGAQTQIEAIRKVAQEAETVAGDKQSKSLFGDPNAQAATLNQLVSAEMAAINKVEDARRAAADGDLDLQAEIDKQRVALDESAAEQMARNNKNAADQVRSDWEKVNKDIGDGLASSIDDALLGKKGGMGTAFGKWINKQLTSAMGDALSGVAKQGEGALGLSGNSPGQVLGSGLNQVGLGGVGNFFGLGGGDKKPEDALKDVATKANTTAIQALTAQLATQHNAVAANTSATTSGTAADMTNTGSLGQTEGAVNSLADITGQHSGVTEALQAATKLQTIATLPNTAATISNTIATVIEAAAALLPFAAGGDPPAGKASLVGEHGPELFVPGHQGRIVSNENIRSAMTSGSSSIGTKLGSYNVDRESRSTTASTTNSGTFNQTNHFGGGQAGLHAAIAESIRTVGHSGTRQFVQRMARSR